MVERVLWVDDDPDFLFLVRKVLEKRVHLELCTSAEEALSWIVGGRSFAVVVSDMRMPGMDGRDFLSRLNQRGDAAIRIMLTGSEELAIAQAAINEGNVFRFLTKSASASEIIEVVDAAMERFLSQRAQRAVLESTLVGAVKALMEVLALTQPAAFSRGERIRSLAVQLSRELEVWDWQIEIAALLSQLGCVAIAQSTMERIVHGREIDLEEQRIFDAHPLVGSDLLAKIPRLEGVARIVRYQHRQMAESSWPDDATATDELPIGSRILKVVIDFDRLCASGISAEAAIVRLRSRPGWYDGAVLEAFERCERLQGFEKVRLVKPTELQPGMVLSEDLTARDGHVIAFRRQPITDALKWRLRNSHDEFDLSAGVKVFDAA
ncbi:MAG: HD domain-containing phosphohydrolase [Tepidiformaceae bacterium]